MALKKLLVALTLSGCWASSLDAAPRDVQIRTVDIGTGVIELFNFGNRNESLDGWRFCTHDSDQVRVYSSLNGLNGLAVAPQSSLFIHLRNDAPTTSNAVNASQVGSFAGPFNAGPYSMGLYFAPATFGNPNQIADHLQWGVDGVGDASAGTRSLEAQMGMMWTDATAWISTTSTTQRIELTDTTGGELHGPDDYLVSEEPEGPSPRSVQIVFIDIGNSVVELFNFASESIPLDGWIFCSHDENENRVYTNFDGLDGVSISGFGTLRIHLNNDAAGAPDAIDASTIGPFAAPLGPGPYSLGLYFPPVNFDDGQQLADHLQWSVGGAHNAVAAERSDEAVSGGVWSGETAWISTDPGTLEIHLDEPLGLELHGPDDYILLPEPAAEVLFRRGEVNNDGSINIADGVSILNWLFAGGVAPTCLDAVDMNNDGNTNIADGIGVLNALFAGSVPPPPFDECGLDPADPADELGCESFPACP